jgi:hypothetical protein
VVAPVWCLIGKGDRGFVFVPITVPKRLAEWKKWTRF